MKIIEQKYYVVRVSTRTGKTEYKRTKCSDQWTGASYKNNCWKFSYQGARGIVDRETKFRGWGYTYHMEPCR